MSLRHVLILLIVILISGSVVHAQGNNQQTCPAFVNSTLAKFGNNCARLGSDEVCFGFDSVESSFAEGIEVLFSQPADRARVSALRALRTGAFDLASGEWGISLLNLQANLPNVRGGLTARLLLIGDTFLESAVIPGEELILTGDTVEAVVKNDTADVYEYPLDFGKTEKILGVVANGARFQVDGVSPSGDWVRILIDLETDYGRKVTAWIRKDALEDADFSSLPEIGPDSLTPMQSFLVINGDQDPECDEATPSQVILQAPDDIELVFFVNGAEIRANGALSLQAFSGSKILRVVVLSGIARVYPDTDDQIIIPAGYSASACMKGPFDNIGVDRLENDYVVDPDDESLCKWTLLNQLSQREHGFLKALEKIPANVLDKLLTIPDVVCASGIGGIVCELRYGNVRDSSQIANLCDKGQIPSNVCEVLFGN